MTNYLSTKTLYTKELWLISVAIVSQRASRKIIIVFQSVHVGLC